MASARVITAAALIMISVFAAFVRRQLDQDDGCCAASAVFIDATVVRMIIVPSVMTLFDKAGWWLPNWLNWLPDLDVEGENLLHQLGDSAAVTPAIARSPRIPGCGAIGEIDRLPTAP